MQYKAPLILAHDYLIQMGGAERVVASMMRHHTEAPLLTSLLDTGQIWPDFDQQRVHTTWMRNVPGMPARFKHMFPLYPAAFRSFGEVTCDVAWISCSTFSKCLRLTPESVSICYCHNPTRFLWQPEEYLNGEVSNSFLKHLAALTFPWLKRVDLAAARAIDIMIANSENVRQRIKSVYHRDAAVIHPPVEVNRFKVSTVSEDYHLIVSRLLKYKRIDRAVAAFSRSGERLIIAGEGPDRERLERLAGPSVEFVGRRSDAEVEALYARCRGLIFTGDEDFGITPVEAQACGKPVIALARGGALETVIDGLTGVFYHDDNPEALWKAVETAQEIPWDPHLIRRHAEGFSEEHFLRETSRIIDEARRQHQDRLRRRTGDGAVAVRAPSGHCQKNLRQFARGEMMGLSQNERDRAQKFTEV